MNLKNKTIPKAGRFTLLFLFSIAFATSALAQNVLTPQHVAKIKSVTSTAISEDGSHVAYTVSHPADPYKENSPSSNYLYVLDVAEETTKPYYTTGSVSSVQFRPGNGTITFITSQPGDNARSLYEIPLDGGEAVKVFEFGQSILSYSWHADGNHLAFIAREEAESSASPLPYHADVYEENLTNRKAYITNVAMDDHPPHELMVDGSVYMAEWSPQGDRVAVSAAPTPYVDDQYMSQQVFIVDHETQEVVAEINNEGKLGQIEWSPNGSRLALRAGADIHDPIDGRILIVSANGGVPQIIDREYEGKYEQIEWTGDETIHFLASEGTSVRIGTISSNGSNKKTIFYTDAHAVGSFSRAANGAISFEASAPDHPTELYFLPGANDAEPVRMTYHNTWLNGLELGDQEVIEYEARDGEFSIQGILIYPVGYEAGTRVPVITQVHGGPEAHYSNGWLTSYSMPGQVGAGKGYAVFYPNYRGSTGRGIEFIYSSQEDLAGKEFDDIVDGVDYLIEQGIADEDRVGVTGGSYGGYASAWMSTYYSERFAASVMFVGISNNLSKWGESDIPEELYLVHSRERLWNDWMGFLRRSPVYHVQNAQTPILIMHGAEDTRVHPSQSLELYRHLKVRKPDLPLRLVFYPGEGHGNTRASSRLDYSYRMLRWFDTYLMTGDPTAEKPGWQAPVPQMDE